MEYDITPSLLLLPDTLQLRITEPIIFQPMGQIDLFENY